MDENMKNYPQNETGSQTSAFNFVWFDFFYRDFYRDEEARSFEYFMPDVHGWIDWMPRVVKHQPQKRIFKLEDGLVL